MQREKLAADSFVAYTREFNGEPETRFNDDRGQFKSSRTIGGYSVPYRDKRNPLGSTRLSCYKPIIDDKHFEAFNLKNYKSVDDFLSLNTTEPSDTHVPKSFAASTKDLRTNSNNEPTAEMPKMNQPDRSEPTLKVKKHSIGGKFRSKTQKLFSRIYSNSNLRSSSNSSSDVCNDFILQRPINVLNSRRSLSYGTLPGVNEFEIKKIETEDADSGIMVNESGASSMAETDSGAEDAKIEFEIIAPPDEFQEKNKLTASPTRYEMFLQVKFKLN